MSYSSTILAEPNLVAYWRMNETTGTTMVDSKGTNHGQYHGDYILNRNGPTLYAGPSVFFDGVFGWADVPLVPALQVAAGSAPFSVEAWIYYLDPVHFEGAPVAAVSYVYAGPNYRLEYGLFAGGSIGPQPGAWHHFAITYDGGPFTGSNDHTYVDGFLTSYPFFGELSVGTGTPPFFQIARAWKDNFGNYEYFRGYISNVALYNAALTQAQIVNHVLAGFTPDPAPHAVSASASIVFTPLAANVPIVVHGQALVTQVVAEVVRGQSDGFAYVTQVVVETLRPYVAGSVNTFDVASSASIVFTATAAAARSFTASASAEIVFTARGNGHHGLYKASSASIVFTARAALNASSRGSVGHVTIIFRARAKNKFLPVVFGDDYLGRFQIGQEVPLWDLVRDQHGQPALPTVAPPEARVYNLDTRRFVETVSLTRLRGSRNDSVYTRGLTLGALYSPGRHAVTYRAASGGFTGYNLAIFEVVAGGDPSGPVQAAHTLASPAGDQVVAHLGSGALARGSRPRVP